MTIYTSLQSPINLVPLGSLAGSIAAGTDAACEAIASEIQNRLERGTCVAAIDGGLGIPYRMLAGKISEYFPGITDRHPRCAGCPETRCRDCQLWSPPACPPTVTGGASSTVN